jgi:cation transport ATPase
MDTGVAMINGCNLAREVADVVLFPVNFQSLCRIIRIGRSLISWISGNQL